MAAPAPTHPRHFASLWLCHLAALLILSVDAHGAPKWKPVNPSELAEQKPQVDPEADAEYIVREVVMDHQNPERGIDTHYNRAKIYTQHGVEEFTKIDIPYDDGSFVTDFAARTIKPDGTIVEINPKDVFDRDVVKLGAQEQSAKSFALAGLEPGSIIEYTYTLKTTPAKYVFPLYFQTDYPTRLVRYKICPPPLPGLRAKLRVLSFNCPDQPLKTDSKGALSLEMTNIAAAKEEPFAPPAINTIAAMLIYPTEATNKKDFWKDFQKSLNDPPKTDNTIKEALASIIAPDDSAATKLAKIHDFCRSKITNRTRKREPSEIKEPKISFNATSAEVLKGRQGLSFQINMLFASFARAAGFDTQLIACNDRNDILFNPELTEIFTVPHRAIAVLVDGSWHFYDPGAKFLPADTLYWKYSDTTGIFKDPKSDNVLQRIPGNPADANTRHRKATLKLDEDGNLDGDVTETYSGQWEADMKNSLEPRTTDKRETFIKGPIQKYQNTAEVTEIKVELEKDPLVPLRISYHLHIPNYADKTSSRLLFQPAVFQKGTPPLFGNAKRRTDITFHYRMTEKDEVHITMPDGFRFEQPSAPAPLSLGDFGSYDNQLSIVSKGKALTCVRTFRRTSVSINKSYYPTVMAAFQALNKRDNHTLSLKRRESPPAATPPAPAPSTPANTSEAAPAAK